MNIKINLNIFLFIIIFAITHQIEIYSLMMIFAFIHELGHLLCGILLGFSTDSFKIMPLGFSIKFKTKIYDYNKKILKSNIITLKKLLISVAGPLTNVIIIVLTNLLHMNKSIIDANLIILLFNLIPIYPLDGARIIKNLFKLFLGNKKAASYTNKVSNLFVLIVTVFSSIAIYYYKNIAILLALIVVWSLIINENKKYNTYNKIYKVIDKERKYI